MNAFNFLKINKKLKQALPAIPSKYKTKKDKVNWLLNFSDFGFLHLPLEIPLKNWREETKYAQSFFVSHRETDSSGWESCCIHGIDIDKTGSWTNYGYTNEKDVPYRWTTLSDYTSSIKKFCLNFPYENFKRIRLMKLKPNGYINPHSDAPGKLPGELGIDVLEIGVPINIAIIQPEDCYFSLENYGTIPFTEGSAFLINIRNVHSVINLSNKERIHLIMQGCPGNKLDEFIDMVVDSYYKQYECDKVSS